MRSLLVPSLVFTSGDGTGSYALGQEHAKTFDKLCDGMLDGTKDCLLNQLVKHILAYNFPRSAWEKDGTGEFQKNELTIEEVSKEADVLDKAITFGAIDMNDMKDLNAVRSKIGFDARDTPIEKPGDEEGDDGSPFGGEEKKDAPVED